MITVYGTLRIKDGQPVIDAPRSGIAAALMGMYGEGAQIRIDFRHNIRPKSNATNAFYWGTLLPIILNEAKRQGNFHMTIDDIHAELKRQYSPDPESTKNLSHDEFEQYVEQCRTFATDFFNCAVPDIPSSDHLFPT